MIEACGDLLAQPGAPCRPLKFRRAADGFVDQRDAFFGHAIGIARGLELGNSGRTIGREQAFPLRGRLVEIVDDGRGF
ncbi:hypothetical protein N8D56_15740 [Devosia sp. A8/3-2]|nr:hypothetical protein N8D56_15740 [Devosia sp. A8/3-2]